MKFRNLILAVALAFLPVVALANMTDQQIIEYIAKEQKRGTSQSEITQQLMKKGVTVQQLQRVKEKYGSSNSRSSRSGGTVTSRRTRGNRVGSAASSDDMSAMNMGTGMGMATMQQGAVSSSSQVNLGRVQSAPGKDGRYDENSSDYTAMNGLVGDMTKPGAIDTLALEDKGPKVYGRDIFTNENVVFEPVMNIPTPANYVLGAGDLLFIDISGASVGSYEAEVSPDGKIMVDDFGVISVGGMTVSAATKRIKSKLGSVYSNSDIVVSLGETRSIQVNVMGEVLVPGTYTMSAFASIFHALYYAGGVSDIGSLREVKLFRAGELIDTFDLYDFILNGNITSQIRLEDNDVVVVSPYLSLVKIDGKVKRPMFYEMKPDETVAQALQYAGGYASNAYTKSMRLNRKGGGLYTIINVDESNINTVQMVDGDSIFVDSLVMRYSNMIEVKGAVFHPGMYELSDNTNSVRKLIEASAGLTEMAMTNRAVIHRLRKDRTLELVRVDLAGIMAGSAADVALCNEDVLFIPTLDVTLQDQVYSIFGDVYSPGVYKFAHNTTVEDLVLQAGGLQKSASNQVKLSRRKTNRDASSSANRTEQYTFTLKDGMVVEGDANFILEPFDEVYVLRSPSFSAPANVMVEGEVCFPGTYGLKADARLSDLFNMCGGLTPQAAENGAYVLRQMNEEELRLRQKSLDNSRFSNTFTIERYTSGAMSDNNKKHLPLSDSLLIERDMREDFYKVAIELKKVLKKPGSSEDLVLRDGDRIVISPQVNTVKLSGAVAYASAVPYVKGERLKFYLRQSGVQPSIRNIRASYVIGPNGQAKAGRRRMEIEPGSEIVLVQRNEPLAVAQKVSIFASIGSTLATVTALVISVLK